MTICAKSSANGFAKDTKARSELWHQVHRQQGLVGITSLSPQGSSLAHQALHML
jgi:hypothetical protein